MSLGQEQPPEKIEEDLKEFLGRRFIDISNQLNQPSKFPERKEMPYKPQTGDVHYFGDPATHSYDAVISSEGFWGLESTGWVKLSKKATGVSGLGVWRYRTETGTPPASGQIRFDNVNVSAATEFYLSETNDGGTDVSAFLELTLQAGALLYIQDQTDANNYMLIEIASSVDSGSYRTYGITTIIEAGTEPGQNDTVILVTGNTATGIDISNLARTDINETFTMNVSVEGQAYHPTGTLTDGANISWDLDVDQTAKVTLAGNRTLDNPTNQIDGATYILKVIQDVTGTRTLAFGTAYKFVDGLTPIQPTAANAYAYLTFISDGTNMNGVQQKDFS